MNLLLLTLLCCAEWGEHKEANTINVKHRIAELQENKDAPGNKDHFFFQMNQQGKTIRPNLCTALKHDAGLNQRHFTVSNTQCRCCVYRV
jgi:hypothetical protein